MKDLSTNAFSAYWGLVATTKIIISQSANMLVLAAKFAWMPKSITIQGGRENEAI